MSFRANPLSIVCGVIAAPTVGEMRDAVIRAASGIIELRIDALEYIGVETIEALSSLIKEVRRAGKKVIVTLRDAGEGGRYDGDPEEKASILLKLARSRPDYIDVEASNPVAGELAPKILGLGVSTIVSSHHLNRTLSVDEIDAIIDRATELVKHHPRPGAGLLIKVVYTCRSPLDELPAMEAMASYTGKLISFAVGENCIISRLLAPFIGAPFTYAHAHGGPQAPGQPSVTEVVELWRELGLL